MAKKWNEVLASPAYQSLSAPEKAEAQADYFNTVVKPQLSADQVDDAHSEFYKQYPVGTQPQTQTAPQTPQEAPEEDNGLLSMETLKGLGRSIAGAPVALANVGVSAYNTLGQNVQAASNAITGEHGQFEPMQAAGYGEADKYLAPRGEQEQAAAQLLGTAPLMAVAPEAGMIARNAAVAAPMTMAAHPEGLNSTEAAKDLAVNTAVGVGAEYGLGKIAQGVRSMLPESLGGVTQAEKAAAVANPEYVENVLQGGNEEAQQAFRTATTDEAGNSILTPSQTMNTVGGKRYIAAEQRDLTRGDQSVYAPRFSAQKEGESFGRAVEGADNGNTLQEAAQGITGQFKKQSSALYNDSKEQAQNLLDSKRITSLKLPETKKIATQHLEANTAAGNINLNAETRRTLTQLNKAKINNIDQLDNWKRTLNEKIGKSMRSGDYASTNALRETLNSLRGEADNVISRIDPNAGSIYRDADKYFSESVGDFGTGKKSVLGKVASAENPDIAANPLLRGQNAAFNARNSVDAMQDALASGSLDDAARLATDFSSSLGQATRGEALRAATTGENFSATKFTNSLARLEPQAEQASRLGTLAGADRDELAVNNALRNAVETTRTKAAVSTPLNNVTSQIVGRSVGGTVGGAVGGITGGVIGQEVGGRAANAIQGGLIDRFMGTNVKGSKYIDFLSKPENAAAVQEILQREGGINAPMERIKGVIDTLSNGATGYASVSAPTAPQSDYNHNIAPIEPEPVQRAQSYSAPQSATFEPRITRLYKALAHAETGGLNNRFIRTKAAESGVSTAYGPAQITVTLMEDFAKRHGKMFNAKERDYISRFINQGEHMKHAPANDPVYGYGGTGTLNSKEDQKLYANIARKMLSTMVQENGGSLDKTVMKWRGNDSDHAYFSKVRDAFKAS